MSNHSFEIGDRIVTRFQWIDHGTIIKPRAANLPKPGPDWYLVRYDDGTRGYIHADMMRWEMDGESAPTQAA